MTSDRGCVAIVAENRRRGRRRRLAKLFYIEHDCEYEHEAAANSFGTRKLYCSYDAALKYWPPFGLTFRGWRP